MTEFQILSGKVYFSPLIDCFDGLVVSWTIGARPDSGLINTMLDAAINNLASSESRPIIHFDRGAHSWWPGCLTGVRNAKLTRSTSRNGCSPGNAACEGFFGRPKTQLFHPKNGRAQPSSNLSRSLTLSFTSTTKSVPRFSLAHSINLNTEEPRTCGINQFKFYAAHQTPTTRHTKQAT